MVFKGSQLSFTFLKTRVRLTPVSPDTPGP